MSRWLYRKGIVYRRINQPLPTGLLRDFSGTPAIAKLNRKEQGELLRNLNKDTVVEVCFTKKDGSRRRMIGTIGGFSTPEYLYGYDLLKGREDNIIQIGIARIESISIKDTNLIKYIF